MNNHNHYPAITIHTETTLLRNKAELALWLVGMVLASLYVILN